MLDPRLKGTALTPFSARAERDRLRAFAQATGQTDPVYSDEAAAHAQGYPALPVPPTHLFCLGMNGPKPKEVYERLGIDYARVLHGEQHFVYHRPVFAGQTLMFRPRIVDLYEKRGGALEFIVLETCVEGTDGAPVAELRSVMVVVQRPPGDGRHLSKTSPESLDLAPGGQHLPGLVAGPVSRQTLDRYAAASGDDNPLHIDTNYARRAGWPDVFAHGMWSAAHLARVVTQWADPASLRCFHTRFVAVTHLADEVHCQARVAGRSLRNGKPCASIELTACNQRGEVKVVGTAIVAGPWSGQDHIRPGDDR
jgi:acyl dehydratase